LTIDFRKFSVFHLITFAMTVFSLLTVGISWHIYTHRTSYPQLQHLGDGQFLAFVSLLALAAVAFGYVTLVGLLNRMTIHFDERRLSVCSEPLPWFGTQNVATERIGRFRACELAPNMESSSVHRVEAELGRGRTAVVVGWIYEEDKASHIQHALQDHLDHIRQFV